MDEKVPETAPVPAQTDLQVVLRGAVSLQASATTSESERRADLLRGKQRIVLSFFRHTGKLPSEVEPTDVQGWLRDLEEKGISAGTCYQHACLLSSFFSWVTKDLEVGQRVRRNPARLARPKAPKPYQTESVKPLSTRMAWNAVQRWADYGRLGRLSPHDLRRTAITRALDQGLSYRQVQMMSGHKDPKTVMRYDHGRENLEQNAVNFLDYSEG